MDKILSDFRVRLSRHISPGAMRAIRPFLTVQFFTFMLMGVINTAVSISVATALDYIHINFLPPDNTFRVFAARTNLNFIIGYVTSIVTSFFLNSKYTFHKKPTFRRFLRFPLSYIPNFIFQYIFVFLFTLLGLFRPAAYICAAITGTAVTYVVMKLFVYNRRK
ncbi:MAG: GtrA family protein [Clostridia bacterium]|nr:GtrA family protein [Clostridia bacterium]